MPWTKRIFSRAIGSEHERQAEHYLMQQGLTPVTKNYHCRQGEIDLVMRDGDTLVFIEVKYRHSTQYGHPSEYFHASKRRKFEQTIAHYLHQQKLNPANVPLRIDVIAISKQNTEWFKGV